MNTKWLSRDEIIEIAARLTKQWEREKVGSGMTPEHLLHVASAQSMSAQIELLTLRLTAAEEEVNAYAVVCREHSAMLDMRTRQLRDKDIEMDSRKTEKADSLRWSWIQAWITKKLELEESCESSAYYKQALIDIRDKMDELNEEIG